ncbi:MAG: IS21 family transposase [Pseudomonadota bacterium]|nr:IS21 family transposase [Pseudomonadota bacterium]
MALAKGRVERSIRYIRDSFFAARDWRDLDDLNAQARAWCVGQSADRRCPEDPSLTVREAFSQEQSHLLALPDNPFPAEEYTTVHAGKTPYVRFDLNDYSIPHDQVRRPLTVRATLTQVTVQNGLEVVAQHRRCYAKGEQIEDPAHIDALLESKQQARRHRGQDRLARAAPASQALLVQAAQRGNRLSTTVSLLVQLLDDYGAVELEIALAEALQQQVPHPNAVRQVLERRREQRRQPPPIAIALPDHPQANALVVRPASLELYDRLDGSEAPDHASGIPSATKGKDHDETN